MADKHAWIEQVTASLPQEKIRAKIADENRQWEFIDGEMVKLGSLGHSTLDIARIQQEILALLASESKDFRLIAHLLRTLQHGSQPRNVILAVELLCAWVKEYWSLAWPENKSVKRRLAQQVLKRFDAVASTFSQQANRQQQDAICAQLMRLGKLWPDAEKALINEANALSERFRQLTPGGDMPDAKTSANKNETSGEPAAAAPAPAVEVDSHNDKAWRDTQLKIAGILCARQPGHPVGYHLRRNAVWQGIVSAPLAQADGRTALAAFSADRLADYEARINEPDEALWQQVEQSLALSPYWFDGHRLSADIALRLGHQRVAAAIKEELACFLQRLPQLTTLAFEDRTPFLSAQTQSWLEENEESTNAAAMAETDEQAVWECWRQQGLAAALALLDRQAGELNPRGKFYCQLLSARLLSEAGMAQLAQQSYRHLYQTAQETRLPEWEPELVRQLQQASQQALS